MKWFPILILKSMKIIFARREQLQLYNSMVATMTVVSLLPHAELGKTHQWGRPIEIEGILVAKKIYLIFKKIGGF